MSILKYTWGEDIVHFELIEEPGGCLLILKETITSITDHSSKDLAGWHVCLQFIEAIQDDGKEVERKIEWKHWQEQYAEILNKLV
ncbi:hypothetical protein [Bacillus horti]|uniref:hypothetical protein n=1 Tax=Caldalkalibacillus horti TaxID=77523 RepID=UPI0027D8BD56|nr:hypothetical protein [Bacillus horti]